MSSLNVLCSLSFSLLLLVKIIDTYGRRVTANSTINNIGRGMPRGEMRIYDRKDQTTTADVDLELSMVT